MSDNEFTKSAFEDITQAFQSIASSLIDSGAVRSDENLLSIAQSEIDELPERFQTDSPQKTVNKHSETDNAFIREQPW